MPRTGGSGSHSIGSSCVAHRRHRRRGSPTSASTASPRKRTSSTASTGWSLRSGIDAERRSAPARPPPSGCAPAPGCRSSTGAEIADPEARPVVRRAHQRAATSASGGPAVGAVDLRPVDLAPPVEPRRSRAPTAPCLGRQRTPPASAAASTASDDLPVAGAAAQHAASASSTSARPGRATRAEQVGRRHQHPRRADPALRRAVRQERLAQRGRTAGPPPAPRPSSRRRPAPGRAARRQAQTCSPSSSTVQAPQSPALQPTLVPVRPRSSRSTSASRRNGAASTATARPFTVKATPATSGRQPLGCAEPSPGPAAAGSGRRRSR